MLKMHGQDANVQHAAWRPLVVMLKAQPFMRKSVLDAGGMAILLGAISAWQKSEQVVVQLCAAVRALLPAAPPRPFCEAGGLEILVETFMIHPKSVLLAESCASCLQLLAGVNHIVRRMVLRMQVRAARLPAAPVLASPLVRARVKYKV